MAERINNIMNKIFLWADNYNLIYPSLFVFDKILTLEDSALHFALSTLDFASDSGLPHKTIVNLVKERIIIPIIMYTSRDEMKLSYELLSAGSKKEAKKIAALYTHDISLDINYLMSFPKKTREKLSEVIAPLENYTRSYYFLDYYPRPLRGEKKILKKFRKVEKMTDNVADLVEKYMQRVTDDHLDTELMRELLCSTTLAKVFRCSVVEDSAHLCVYKGLLRQLQNEIIRTPELRKILLETNKVSAFTEVLKRAKLRIPYRLAYPKIKQFRKDSAHRNFSKWLALLYRSTQKEVEPPALDETIIQEFDELAKVLQNEIKKQSLLTTAVLSAFASYLAALHPVAIFAVVSSLASYVPLTYFFTGLYRKFGRNNFIYYFVDWRKPPVKVS